MSVEFYRGSPGKFDSRTLSRETLSRWTGRMVQYPPAPGACRGADARAAAAAAAAATSTTTSTSTTTTTTTSTNNNNNNINANNNTNNKVTIAVIIIVITILIYGSWRMPWRRRSCAPAAA